MKEEEFKLIELISKISIDRASQVFSKTLKSGSKIEIVKIRKIDISRISEEIEANDKEVSGAIVQLNGDTPAKLLFFIDLEKALTLTDLFLRRKPGTTKEFDIYTESTIQEIGNILGSCIANVFVKDFNIELTPAPPDVLNDYSSSIFNSLLMEQAYCNEDDVLLVETKFFIVKTAIECTLFLLPTLKSARVMLKKYKETTTS
jgi:chemotaxis protein CheY-P-specific phosphatase CheC